MERGLLWIGRLAGVLGVAIVLVAVGSRLSGLYLVGRFQVGTLLQAGIAVTVIGCVAYLEVVAARLIRGG